MGDREAAIRRPLLVLGFFPESDGNVVVGDVCLIEKVGFGGERRNCRRGHAAWTPAVSGNFFLRAVSAGIIIVIKERD